MCKFSEPLNDQVPVYPPWTLWEGEVLRAEGAADGAGRCWNVIPSSQAQPWVVNPRLGGRPRSHIKKPLLSCVASSKVLSGSQT